VSTAVASTDGANFSSHDQPDWRGRRRGRRLTAYRRGLLTGLLPNLRVPCSPEGASIDPAVLFASAPRAVWLEVGFGSGEHLAEQARRHPEIGFIGCEVFVNGIAALLDHIERLEITNVRIFDDDARLLLRSLPNGDSSGLSVYPFWPIYSPITLNFGSLRMMPATSVGHSDTCSNDLNSRGSRRARAIGANLRPTGSKRAIITRRRRPAGSRHFSAFGGGRAAVPRKSLRLTCSPLY
jgi:hypothetical protein